MNTETVFTCITWVLRLILVLLFWKNMTDILNAKKYSKNWFVHALIFKSAFIISQSLDTRQEGRKGLVLKKWSKHVGTKLFKLNDKNGMRKFLMYIDGGFITFQITLLSGSRPLWWTSTSYFFESNHLFILWIIGKVEPKSNIVGSKTFEISKWGVMCESM